LVNEAYPRWAQYGIDPQNGGFIEALGQDGLGLFIRGGASSSTAGLRVRDRRKHGLAGRRRRIVSRGMEYFTAHYQRSDGLFRALVAVDGTVLDERVLLYDQAFALLGLAASATALDEHDEFERRAVALRGAIESHFGTARWLVALGNGADAVRESNPHMHFARGLPGVGGKSATMPDGRLGSGASSRSRSRTSPQGQRRARRVLYPMWQPTPGLCRPIMNPASFRVGMAASAV